MNTLFFIIWGLSLIAIVAFLSLTALHFIKKDKAKGKKQLRNAGVSLVVMVASFAIFISTYEPSDTDKNDIEDTITTNANEDSSKQVNPKVVEEKIASEKNANENVELEVNTTPGTEKENEKEPEKENLEIDTSVFKYATSVEVTDARSITKNITLKIDLPNDANAGMGTNHVINQMYDFLQQSDIKGAETVIYFVRVNEVKVAQFKTNVAQFKPDSSQSMASVVLAATDIELLSDEVKSFGQSMELWD